jgi:hypothetical protein
MFVYGEEHKERSTGTEQLHMRAEGSTEINHLLRYLKKVIIPIFRVKWMV